MTEIRKILLPSYKKYNAKSDLHLFIDKSSYTSNINSYDIDLNFIRNAYPNLSNKSNSELIEYVKNLEYTGIFLHSKQLSNIFDNQLVFKDYKNKIYVEYEKNDYELTNFIKWVETYTYDHFKNMLLELKINNNFKSSELLVLAFIGNLDIGLKIIKTIINFKNIQDFQLAICIKKSIYNNEDDRNEIMNLLNKSNLNYILYISNELGNDVTPTLLMYDDIRNNYSFDYVIKTHTKSDELMLKSLNYTVFSTKLENKIMSQQNNNKSFCFGNFKFYCNVDNDNMNRKLYDSFRHLIKKDHFVSGTIFFTNFRVMDNMLIFMKSNYFDIFLQNLYDNNQINKNSSYPHFMERLFGYIHDKYPLNATGIIHK